MDYSFVAILLGLAAAIGWGMSGFFDAKSSRTVHPVVASLTVNGLLTLVYVTGYFLFWNDSFTMQQDSMYYAAGGGAIIAIGALAYFKALAIGPISLASPMSSAYPLVTTLFAVIFFGSVLSVGQGIAIGLIILGILAVTEFLYLITKRKIISRGPLLGLVAATCWGVGYALVAQAVQASGWQQATLIELIAMMLAFGVCIPLLKDRREVTIPALSMAVRSGAIVTASIVALVAALCFNIGLMYDPTGGAIVATFSAFYPVLTVMLAMRHFKEKISRPQFIGASTSIAGVILLAIAR